MRAARVLRSTARPAKKRRWGSPAAGFSRNDGSFAVFNITPLTLNTPLFTNSASGTFALGAIAPVTVSGDFTNLGTLNVDVGFGDGGGNLTISGTLSNSKTVQVGYGSLNAG